MIAQQEILGLLADKRSLKALLDGHEARDNNTMSKTYTVEEVFNI